MAEAETITGEHWESETGKELDKKKDPYVRIQWVVPKEKTITTILTKEGLARDPDLEKTLLDWREKRKELKEDACVLSHAKIGIKDTYIHIEFYNWEKPKTEQDLDVLFSVVRNDPVRTKLDALKTLGKNPTFLPTITCASTGVCKCFTPPSKNKGLNCRHIALRFNVIYRRLNTKEGRMDMAPELYCKRAHPSTLGLPTEKDLNWDVITAGTALVLTSAERRIKDIAKAMKNKKKHAEILEKSRAKFITQIRSFEKMTGLNLNLIPAPKDVAT